MWCIMVGVRVIASKAEHGSDRSAQQGCNGASTLAIAGLSRFDVIESHGP